MNDYSDEDLLFLTSCQNEDEKEAKEAFEIFYHRHKQFLWNLCHKVCRNDETAKDVAQNTWIAIYKSSHTYSANKGGVKTWMSTIAKNKWLDLFKRKTEILVSNEKIFSILDVENEDDIYISSSEKRILDEALTTLSDKEKDILLTYIQFSDGRKHLPDEVLNELCQRYGTTSDHLRQFRKRSFDKINKYITSNKSAITNK